MAKSKYHFNPETLSFKKIEFSFIDDFLKKILSQTAISLFIGFALFLLAFSTIDSPNLQKLKATNKSLMLKYDLLKNEINASSVTLAEIQSRDDFKYRPIFEANPVPKSVRNAGFGGTNKYVKLSDLENSDMYISLHQQMDRLSKQLYVQSKSYDELVKMIKDKDKMMACIPAIRPISNKDLTRFGSPFGMRFHPILKYKRMHAGVDLTAPRGTKVYAAGDGVVVRAVYSNNGLGRNVVINHGYGYKTVYAHLSKLNVNLGDKIKRGDVIGLVGNTGLSTTPHLHYEVRKNDRPVNPVNYYYNDLDDEEYEKMIEMSADANTHVFEK